MRYTPHQVAAALRGSTDDDDLPLDIARCLAAMEAAPRTLLECYGCGYSEREAARIAGLGGNANRHFDTALRKLTASINGDN
jgi:hypothetical protein